MNGCLVNTSCYNVSVISTILPSTKEITQTCQQAFFLDIKAWKEKWLAEMKSEHLKYQKKSLQIILFSQVLPCLSICY